MMVICVFVIIGGKSDASVGFRQKKTGYLLAHCEVVNRQPIS